MAKHKVYSRRKEHEDGKIEDSNQIDLIPKCVQQPRTRSPGGPKRRTDFSLFFFSQMTTSCSSSRDLSSQSHGSRDELTVDVIHDGIQGGRKEISSIHLVLCCQSENKGRLSPEYAELCYKEAESSSLDLQNGYADRTLEYTDEKLDLGGSKGTFQTSVGGERLTCSDSDNASVSGRAPMQLRETEESSLFDPVKSTLRLQDGLPRTELRDASKLMGKDNLHQNAQTFEKPKSSSSSHEQGDILNTGRGKRKKKPKLHFDDMMSPMESIQKARRLKIMRHLGLVAPAGSPFIIPRQ